MDAIELLTRQHREIERLFARVEGGRGTDQHSFFLQLARALRLHTFLEEQIFYPAARKSAEDLVNDSFEDHDTMKRLLTDAEDLGTEHQSFSVQLTDLREAVQDHLRSEEQDLFPQVRKALGADELETMGSDMESSAEEWEQEDTGTTEQLEPQPQTLVEPPANSLDR